MPPPIDIPLKLQERIRDSQNAMIAAVAECFGPDSPLIQELGGYDLSMPEESNPWYDEYLKSEDNED